MRGAPTNTAEPEQPRAGNTSRRGGRKPVGSVYGSRAMAVRCETTSAIAVGAKPLGDLEGVAREHLLRVSRPGAAPLAIARVRERDLVFCDGAGLALYTLRIAARSAGWEQRTISYPPDAELRALYQHPRWARQARRLCLASPQARACRVPVGVVAAEARAATERGELSDGEETVYRLSEAAAALLQGSGKEAAKAGRKLMVAVERARHPSHVPLYRLQGALAEELALGHSLLAICSRSPRFSEAANESQMASLLFSRLGLEGARDYSGRRRYARVAAADVAELLCEALDLAPEQVGL